MNAAVLSPVDTLLEAAKRLTNREQGEFLDRFLDLNYDGNDSDEEQPLSPEWMAEIKHRIAQDEAGLSEWIPAEDVICGLRDTLSQPA